MVWGGRPKRRVRRPSDFVLRPPPAASALGLVLLLGLVTVRLMVDRVMSWCPDTLRFQRRVQSNGDRLLGCADAAGYSGVVTAWSLRGQRVSTTEFKMNKPHGEFVELFPEGSPKVKGHFTNGEVSGSWVYLDAHGTKMREETYADGTLQSETDYWSVGGVSRTGKYSKGERDGLWRSFEPDGTPTTCENWLRPAPGVDGLSGRSDHDGGGDRYARVFRRVRAALRWPAGGVVERPGSSSWAPTPLQKESSCTRRPVTGPSCAGSKSPTERTARSLQPCRLRRSRWPRSQPHEVDLSGCPVHSPGSPQRCAPRGAGCGTFEVERWQVPDGPAVEFAKRPGGQAALAIVFHSGTVTDDGRGITRLVQLLMVQNSVRHPYGALATRLWSVGGKLSLQTGLRETSQSSPRPRRTSTISPPS